MAKIEAKDKQHPKAELWLLESESESENDNEKQII